MYPHLYRLRSFTGNTTAASPIRFHLIFMYGAPSGEGRQTFGPSRFLHFEVAGGTGMAWFMGFDTTGSDGADLPLGPAVMAGHSGTLYYERPRPYGGEWGDHYIFRWQQDGTHYFASLHAWGSRAVVVRTLSTIMDGLVPANGLRS